MDPERESLLENYYYPIREVPEERYIIKEQSTIDGIIHTLVKDTLTERYSHYRIPLDSRSKYFTVEKIITHTAAPLHIAKEIFGKNYNFDYSNYKE